MQNYNFSGENKNISLLFGVGFLCNKYHQNVFGRVLQKSYGYTDADRKEISLKRVLKTHRKPFYGCDFQAKTPY